MKYQLGAALVWPAYVTSHVSVLCVSRICAQLCYQLNLQRGKQQLRLPAWTRPVAPGWAPAARQEWPWVGAAGGGSSLLFTSLHNDQKRLNV